MISIHKSKTQRKDGSPGVYVKLIDRRTRKARQFTVRGITPAKLERVLMKAVKQTAQSVAASEAA